jgi:TRAP-type mannitol/chloroaromatic compound transport system permease large subunit
VLTLLIALLFIKLSLGYVMQSYSIGETSADPGGIPWRWAVKGLIPLGFGLLALQTVGALLRLVLSSERLGRRVPEPQTYAMLMLVAFFVLLMLGVPVAVTLATVGFVFGWLGFGDALFNLLPARMYGVVAGYQWMAIPLFVFMGVMLEKSRLADDLLDVMGHIAGGVRGGMGVGIILFGVLMGATTGIVGATIITLGLLTLPTLIRRGYDKRIACGAICASGTLGQIIPPSLILILLSDIMQLSVGTLFAAAVGPGLLLAAVYIIFLLLLGWWKPT